MLPIEGMKLLISKKVGIGLDEASFDQGVSQSIRMVQILPAILAFDTELSLAHHSLGLGEETLDAPLLHFGTHIAPYTAIGTDTVDYHHPLLVALWYPSPD